MEQDEIIRKLRHIAQAQVRLCGELEDLRYKLDRAQGQIYALIIVGLGSALYYFGWY